MNIETANLELGIIGKDWLERNGFDCSEENLKTKEKAATMIKLGKTIKYYDGLFDFIISGLKDKKFTINDLVNAAYDNLQIEAKTN